ncbi:EAL domain-containing response regulator [Xanthomonadaceae bacterium JHOS43]|nr:EAL domain-containing response regulator [Xanthomonadaceae bacterium JHOS43]
MKILVVDDDDFTTRLLRIQLQAMGLRASGFDAIELCPGGREALAKLAPAPDSFGLVFCDLRMPSMDGVEFVRHLAAMGYKGGLVLISGTEPRVLQAVEQLARQQGVNVLGTLAKPVSPDDLRAVLAQRRETEAAPHVNVPTPSMAADVAALEAAIVDGALFNDYQPKVDLQTGEVVGVEALARWQHPDRGILQAADFMPLAERSGLVTSVAHAVLANALYDARDWCVEARGLDVAVNIPLGGLSSLELPDRMATLATAAGFPLERLVVELSETHLPTEPRTQLEIMSRLRLKGVRLALDDFGAGFSNLAQLRDLPFSELKIDRGFVRGVASDASRRAIVQAALALARELDVRTTAEGMDNRDDLACLRTLGCHQGQGTLVAEPMPASEVVAWLDNWPQHRESILAA